MLHCKVNENQGGQFASCSRKSPASPNRWLRIGPAHLPAALQCGADSVVTPGEAWRMASAVIGAAADACPVGLAAAKGDGAEAVDVNLQAGILGACSPMLQPQPWMI
jgi:hypothetical protein